MKKKKPKPLSAVQKLKQTIKTQAKELRGIKVKLRESTDRNVRIANEMESQSRSYQSSLQYKGDLVTKEQNERQKYYEQLNQKTAKCARLEKAVTSLKEGTQKILLAFDVLN